MKKILASDYDHTLYLDDEDMEKNKKAIKEFKQAENIFVIATGRSYIDLKRKVDAYNLEYDYAIIDHGATIIDNKDNVLFSVEIDETIIKDIQVDLQLEKSISYFCCSLFESRVDFNHKNLTKINVKYNTRQEAWDINELINEKYGKYVNSYFLTSNSIEIISKKTNKSNAIDILSKKLNIDKENVYTIGDGYSDMEMIRDFNGYRMENSVPELKQMEQKSVNSVSELIKKLISD